MQCVLVVLLRSALLIETSPDAKRRRCLQTSIALCDRFKPFQTGLLQFRIGDLGSEYSGRRHAGNMVTWMRIVPFDRHVVDASVILNPAKEL